MKYKFNAFERSVGIFISLTIIGTAVIGVGIAFKRNWFEDKASFHTYVDSANNIRTGSSVYIKGLKVGAIEEVELEPSGIKVSFSILKKYQKSITEGSRVKFLRTFLIGDKTLVIEKGPFESPAIANGSAIPAMKVLDVVDMLNSENLQDTFNKISSVLSNLDETLVLGKDIALQVSDKKKLKITLDNVAFASTELRKVFPVFMKKAPKVGQDMEHIVQNMVVITQGLKELQPIIAQVGKSFPEGSQKTIELLNESIVVLQAMQKSVLLRGSVEEVRGERAQRLPASSP